MKLVEEICRLSRQAGDAIMAIYQQTAPLDVQLKSDDSPVTAADMAAHRLIVAGLAELTPEIPILSEEAPADWETRRHWQRYWLVDPLDGTREFIKRNGEFTVNIALIEQGLPVLGAIYAPVQDLLYAADSRTDSPVVWKEVSGSRQPIKCQHADTPTVLVSRSYIDSELNSYIDTLGSHHKLAVGSSLKFCLIAEGKAQLYPRFGSISIWDTAAGQAIVCAAGGKVIDWQGQPLRYFPQPSLLNQGFCVMI